MLKYFKCFKMVYIGYEFRYLYLPTDLEQFINGMEMNADFEDKFWFTDEVHFHLPGFINMQSCRSWGSVNEMNPKYPKLFGVNCGLDAVFL